MLLIDFVWWGNVVSVQVSFFRSKSYSFFMASNHSSWTRASFTVHSSEWAKKIGLPRLNSCEHMMIINKEWGYAIFWMWNEVDWVFAYVCVLKSGDRDMFSLKKYDKTVGLLFNKFGCTTLVAG